MSAPVDEIDVGHERRIRPPWHEWSRGRRRVAAAVGVVVVVLAGAAWFVLRRPDPPPAAAPVPVASAPGADVVQDLDPDTSKCPASAQCTYTAEVSDGTEAAFRAAFTSAGYIGRQSVLDTVTGEVYYELIRFTTGSLVTVTLTQEPVGQVPNLPQVLKTPTYIDLGESALTANAIRDGYLMTASAATLPGQPLPVRSVRRWVDVVPAP